jgi:class 3 adenylate cyclase/predicted RNA-binding Zn-ribbon protein involved in translation (DUF1610 family)
MEIKIHKELLDEKLAELKKARSWSPRVIDRVEDFICSGDDYSLFRINPLKFGNEINISEQQAIDLFLYGVKIGLFEMNWQLLCPSCGDVVTSFSTLRSMDSHYHCDLCRRDFEATLDDYIEISFTIAPTIRGIAFHDPDSLPIEDFFLKLFSKGTTYPDGTKFVDLLKKSTKILTYLEPKQRKECELEIPPGVLEGYDRLNHTELFFNVRGEAKTGIQKCSIKLVGGKFEPSGGELSPGRIVMDFENLSNKRGSLFLIHIPPDFSPQPLQFEPFLSGKRLLTTQTFRDLFHSETIQGTEGIGIKDITILFTDLKGSTALYDSVGDLKAFGIVRQHFDSLGKVINSHSGVIVKTIGDAIMVAFLNPIDAVKAAISMLEEIERFNQKHGARVLILKVGIHKGTAIAVTLNDRLDYFGQTVNIASRVGRLADADEIYVTHEVFTYPGIQEILENSAVDPVKANLKGVQEEARVYKINSNLR